MRLAGPGQENPAPAACSACFQASPEELHVDFEAAWDGPRFKDGVMGENGEVSNAIVVAIDDLVLCEGCLRAAHGLLPLDPESEANQDALVARVRELEGESQTREAYVEKLEAAFEAKGERQRGRAPQRASA